MANITFTEAEQKVIYAAVGEKIGDLERLNKTVAKKGEIKAARQIDETIDVCKAIQSKLL